MLNLQGDVIGLMNSDAEIVANYQYDPWGAVLSCTGSEASTIGAMNPLRYRGYYYDTETGFYYLQSRYYDPALGRFINSDTYSTTDTQGFLSYKMFAYCENDPVNKEDHEGDFPSIIAGVLIGAGSQYVTFVIVHRVAGQSWKNSFKLSREEGFQLGTAALNGALATVGLPPRASQIMGGAIAGVNKIVECKMQKKKIDFIDLTYEVGLGVASGTIGKGMNAKEIKTQMYKSKYISRTSPKLKRIAKHTKLYKSCKKELFRGYRSIVRGSYLSAFSNILKKL